MLWWVREGKVVDGEAAEAAAAGHPDEELPSSAGLAGVAVAARPAVDPEAPQPRGDRGEVERDAASVADSQRLDGWQRRFDDVHRRWTLHRQCVDTPNSAQRTDEGSRRRFVETGVPEEAAELPVARVAEGVEELRHFVFAPEVGAAERPQVHRRRHEKLGESVDFVQFVASVETDAARLRQCDEHEGRGGHRVERLAKAVVECGAVLDGDGGRDDEAVPADDGPWENRGFSDHDVSVCVCLCSIVVLSSIKVREVEIPRDSVCPFRTCAE